MDIILKPFGFRRCSGSNTTICYAKSKLVSTSDGKKETVYLRTVVFAVPSDPKTSSLYSRKTESNGLSKCCGINMRNSVLVADPPIREIKSLTGYIAIRIWCIIGGQPATQS